MPCVSLGKLRPLSGGFSLRLSSPQEESSSLLPATEALGEGSQFGKTTVNNSQLGEKVGKQVRAVMGGGGDAELSMRRALSGPFCAPPGTEETSGGYPFVVLWDGMRQGRTVKRPELIITR